MAAPSPTKRALHKALDTLQRSTPRAVREAVRPLYLPLYKKLFPKGRRELAPNRPPIPTPPVAPVSNRPAAVDSVPTTAPTHRTHPSPKVSIILPVWNHANLLGESIASVLAQTYTNLELLVIDDGSTTDIRPALEPHWHDPRLRVIRHPHAGLPATLSAGFRHASGELWTWTSADNLMHEDMLARLVPALLTHPDTGMVYANMRLIDAGGRPLRDSDYRPAAQRPGATDILDLPRSIDTLGLAPDNFIGAGFLYRREHAQAIGPYDESLLGTEDYDYWLRMSLITRIRHAGIDEPLYAYRVHDDSLSGKKAKQIAENARTLLTYHRERALFCQDPFDIITVSFTEAPETGYVAEWLESLCHGHRRRHLDLSRTEGPSVSAWLLDRDFHKRLVILLDDEALPSLAKIDFAASRAVLLLVNPATATIDAALRQIPASLILCAHGNRTDHLPACLTHSTLRIHETTLSVRWQLTLAQKARDNHFPPWELPPTEHPIALYVGPTAPAELDHQALETFANTPNWTTWILPTDTPSALPKSATILDPRDPEDWWTVLSNATLLLAPFQPTASNAADTLFAYTASAKPVLATDTVAQLGFAQAPGFRFVPSTEFQPADDQPPALPVSEDYWQSLSPATLAQRTLAAANLRLHLAVTRPSQALPRSSTTKPHLVIEVPSLDTGGLERVVALQAQSLRESGYDITVAVHQPGGAIASELAAADVPLAVTHNDPETLRQLLRASDAQLLIPHYAHAGTRIAWEEGIPVLAFAHNAYIWAGETLSAKIREAARYTTHFLAVSSHVRDDYAQRFDIAPDRITVAPNGIDTTHLDGAGPAQITRDTLGLAEDDFILLNVAGISGPKAQVHAAAAVAATRNPHIKLLCVGARAHEDYAQFLEQYIQEKALENQVRLCQPTSRIADYYRLADAFFQPSLTEGWSLAKTEAMHFGLPLILTNVGGAPDVIHQDDIGLLVPAAHQGTQTLADELDVWDQATETNPPNLGALTDAIQELHNNRQLWQQKAQLSPEKVQAHYTQVAANTRHRGAIQDQLHRHTGQPDATARPTTASANNP